MSTTANLTYAGSGIRILAFLIDFGVVTGLGALPVIGRSEKVGPEEAAWEQLAWVVVAGWPYFTLAESSNWQGAVGKKLLGLRVCDLEGHRIGFARANIRYFSKVISYPLFFFVWFIFLVTPRKQALHDWIAGTIVLRPQQPA